MILIHLHANYSAHSACFPLLSAYRLHRNPDFPEKSDSIGNVLLILINTACLANFNCFHLHFERISFKYMENPCFCLTLTYPNRAFSTPKKDRISDDNLPGERVAFISATSPVHPFSRNKNLGSNNPCWPVNEWMAVPTVIHEAKLLSNDN